MLTFTRACLADGQPLPVVAFQTEGTYQGYPIHLVLLCRVGPALLHPLGAQEFKLVTGDFVSLLADVQDEWAKPFFRGYVYHVDATVGLNEQGSQLEDAQFLVKLTHVNHLTPVAPEPEDHLLTYLTEGTFTYPDGD